MTLTKEEQDAQIERFLSWRRANQKGAELDAWLARAELAKAELKAAYDKGYAQANLDAVHKGEMKW